MSRAVYQRRTVTCLATLTESDCTVVLRQKCDYATLIIFISTTTTTTTTTTKIKMKATQKCDVKRMYLQQTFDHFSCARVRFYNDSFFVIA